MFSTWQGWLGIVVALIPIAKAGLWLLGLAGDIDFVAENRKQVVDVIGAPWFAGVFTVVAIALIAWGARKNAKAPVDDGAVDPTPSIDTPEGTTADAPTPENDPTFPDYRDRAACWSTMAASDHETLAARVFMHSRDINFAHLTKKALGQACYLDFTFDLINSSVFTVTIARQIHNYLNITVPDYPLWGSQRIETDLKYIPGNSADSESDGLILRHAERGRLTVRQPLDESVAHNMWRYLAGKDAHFVFRDVKIVLEAVSPDGQVIPPQALQLPTEWEYAIP